MSKLSRLLAKPKEFELEGEKFVFKPLTVDNIELFTELENDTKRIPALKKIIQLMLKDAVPDATDEEIQKVSLTHFKRLTEIIKEVHGLE